MLKKETPIYRESRLRSVLKAFSWRLLATATTFGIAYLVTGKVSIAGSIASLEVVTKIIAYYFHERAWQLLPRGSIRALLKERWQNQPDPGDGP